MTSLESVPLKDLIAELHRRRDAIDDALDEAGIRDAPRLITEAVAASFGVSHSSLWRRSRSADVVLPRQAAMVLLRERLGLSFPRIAHVFNLSHHGSVMHAIRTQEERLTMPRYRQAFKAAAEAVKQSLIK